MTIGRERYVARGFFVNHLSLDHGYEAWLDAAFRSALAAKKGAFIDVGANTGQNVIRLLSLDNTRRYVGFEPQIDCCFFIDQFIRQNDLSHYRIFCAGLSNRGGVARLLKHDRHVDAAASTVEGFRPAAFYCATQDVCVVKGDEFLPMLDLDDASVIKIDVEGAELEVVEGLQETLERFSPFVFFEVLHHFLAATGQELDAETIAFREERTERLDRLFRQRDYMIFHILPEGQLKEISVIQPMVASDLRMTDYVAVHKSCKRAFLQNY